MYKSKTSRIFDLILERLNENTQGVTFSGNFMFKFNQQQLASHNFEIISLEEDALDYTSTEIVPLVDVQAIEIPYVEKNERSDWEREFYVAIKIERGEDAVTGNDEIVFNEEDIRYQAVLETLENMRSNLTFVDGDYKYTFKVKEPTKVNVFKYNREYYQILSLTMNLTELKEGYFGNETKLYLYTDTPEDIEDALLDVVEFNEICSKTSRGTSNANSTEETYTSDKRNWEATVTVNFNGSTPDLLLYDEKSAEAELDQTYTLIVSNETLGRLYQHTVQVASINATYKNNMVEQFTFKLERA